MRVAVIGAGIIGVTTAYELAADGHEVTVYERRGGVAEETSFANAGVLAPGYVTPWAAPGMPRKVLAQLLGRHAAVRIGGIAALAELPWLWRWWRGCREGVHRRNRTAMLRLAHFSVQRLQQLTDALQLDYERSLGLLVLLRSPREAEAARSGTRLLAGLGVKFDWLDGAQARRVEPGLNPATELAAAIHLPHDRVGNCRQFAQLLRGCAQRAGAVFRFDHDVLRLEPGGRPRVHWRHGDDAGAAPFDAVVTCAGHRANALLGAIGLRLPLAPIYGYSITAPLRSNADGDAGPRSALMDERLKVAITRFGQRVRVAGSAEIGGSPQRIDAKAIATLYRVLDDWFPGVAQAAQAQVWKGARPMLPDGPPVLGASGAPGVWLNLGHGSSGWALACGSARVLADLLAARRPQIDLAGLGIDRLRLTR